MKPTEERRWREIGNEVLADFRTIFLGIQDQIEAVAKQQKAKNEREPSPPIVRSEIHILPTINAEKEAREARNERRDKWKIRIEAATFVAVFGYAIINWHMLCEMRRSTAAAENAVRYAKDADRPWIGLKGSSILVNEAEKTFTFSITTVNAGKRPGRIIKAAIKGRTYRDDFPSFPEFNNTSVYKQPSTVLVMPSITSTSEGKATLSPEEYRKIISLKTDTLFYFYELVEYEDVADKTIHHSKICFFYIPDQTHTNAGNCPTYNDGD